RCRPASAAPARVTASARRPLGMISGGSVSLGMASCSRGEKNVRRRPAGPDGTFDGGRQPGGGPIACEDEVWQVCARSWPEPLLCRGCGNGSAPLVHHPPSRQVVLQFESGTHIWPGGECDRLGVLVQHTAGR